MADSHTTGELGQPGTTAPDRRARRQRELYMLFRGATTLALIAFCIAVPIYIYSQHAYNSACSQSLGSWQWSWTIFLWVLLFTCVFGYLMNYILTRKMGKGSPGNILLVPVVLVYLASIGWLIVGTVRLANTREWN